MTAINFIRPALATALILCIPLVAMQLNIGVDWSPSDFAIMGALLFAAGLLFEFVASRGRTLAYRAATALAAVAGLILIWGNLAVGLIGSEDNPANLMYLGVILVSIVGAALARFAAAGMARAMFATAAAQFFVPVIALAVFRPDFAPGVAQVLMLNFGFVVMWAAAGLLYLKAAEKRA